MSDSEEMEPWHLEILENTNQTFSFERGAFPPVSPSKVQPVTLDTVYKTSIKF